MRGGIPFELRVKQPNTETIAAMKELENPETPHRFTTTEEMWEAVEE